MGVLDGEFVTGNCISFYIDVCGSNPHPICVSYQTDIRVTKFGFYFYIAKYF